MALSIPIYIYIIINWRFFIQNYCSEQRRTWWHGQQNYSTCWEISVHILHQTGVWTDQFTSVRCWLSSPLGTTGQLWGCRKRSSFVTSWLLHKSKVRCLASRSSFQIPRIRFLAISRWDGGDFGEQMLASMWMCSIKRDQWWLLTKRRIVFTETDNII